MGFAISQGLRDDASIVPPTGLAEGWRLCVATAPGRNVGRAFSPAAWGLRRCKVSGTMQASSPTDAGQGSAGLCRISPAQSGNAPLRLRLAAHPPSGLRCPHRTARSTLVLCDRCTCSVSLSPPQAALNSAAPCRGGFIKCLPPGRLPCKGSWRRQPTEGCGAVPCPANILPNLRKAPRRAISPAAWGLRHRRVSGTMQASARQRAWRKAGVYALPPTPGRNAPKPGAAKQSGPQRKAYSAFL